MPSPAIDFARKIKDILHHIPPLVDEAKAPIRHYRRSVADVWGLLDHIESAFGQSALPQAVVNRDLDHLFGMALIHMVETFERFLKEVAAECVDCLAGLVLDERFNVFDVQGSALASHFDAGTLGKSLCEASVWLDCKEINERFRKLLADPFNATGQQFYVFPKGTQASVDEIWRFDVMNLVWQLRHTAIHNVGVITRSDAVKFRILAKEVVTPLVVITPTRSDLGFLKQFLDDTAAVCNRRIGTRLAELLTTFHTQAPPLVDLQPTADRLASVFRIPLQVATATGVLPMD